MVAALCPRPGAAIAEIGVALGEFSEFLLADLRPSLFAAIDLFELHLNPDATFRGRTMRSVFGDGTHLDWYRERFGGAGSCVVVEQGLSWEALARFPDESFDLIYLDAGHDLESVRRDRDVATVKIKHDGLLVFNDYIVYDHLHHTRYGVVPNVNDLVVNHGWRVVGFALQRNLYCDIALRRRDAG
jgi:hypothetical protein